MSKVKFISGILIIALCFMGFKLKDNKENNYGKIKSGNLATDYNVDLVLRDIEELELNTINIPVVVNIKDKTSNDIEIVNWSLERAKQMIKEAKKTGVKIIIEPYPWISDGAISETEYKPSNIDTFFEVWENDVIIPIIKELAIPFHVYAINISSNFNELDDFNENWIKIINRIRKMYNGNITYKVSWWSTAIWDENSKERYSKVLDNKVFEFVDFISVASYFELSENNRNSVADLEKSLYSTKRHNRNQNIMEELEMLSSKWDKNIYLAELGFPRIDGAAIEPWNPYLSEIENNLEQARCFIAYKNVVSDKTWFKGFSVFSIGGNEKHHLYYPSNESKKIIKNWFNE